MTNSERLDDSSDKNDQIDAGASVNSDDEALSEFLGLPSLDVVTLETDEEPSLDTKIQSVKGLLLRLSDESLISEAARRYRLKEQFASQGVCVLPEEFSIPSNILRRLTDELIWRNHELENKQVDETYETIQIIDKDGELLQRRSLTRFENFVDAHDEWNELARNYLCRLISIVLGEQQILFKEKLNLKPPGGAGFAPHLDGPSLRVALGYDGPQSFLTVMVAIDDMTIKNGCLRIVKGPWSASNACQTISPREDGSPDASGRAGAIPVDLADTMDFDDVLVSAGTIVAFNAWVPHRSAVNRSHFPRRAVFFTYNAAGEGDHHDRYYERMAQLRNDWRTKADFAVDEDMELQSLATVPRI
jgi:hypothetical protein